MSSDFDREFNHWLTLALLDIAEEPLDDFTAEDEEPLDFENDFTAEDEVLDVRRDEYFEDDFGDDYVYDSPRQLPGITLNGGPVFEDFDVSMDT